MEPIKTNIYSVGYSTHSIESFVDIIKNFHITAIADVRSQPYSQFKPEFNRENLKKTLKKSSIEYVFLGNKLGARIKVPECYKNGQADYQLIAKHPLFQEGLRRIRNGMKEQIIALMCAERDPINCHRMILICRSLKKLGMEIYHILDTNKVESQSESEHRLLKLFKLNQLELFHSKNDQLERAYNKQGKRIAYKEDSNSVESNSEGDFIDAEY